MASPFTPATIPASTFNGGTLTGSVEIDPPASENDAALIIDTTTSGNPRALDVYGITKLHGTTTPFTVYRDGVTDAHPVLALTDDGKLAVTPDINTNGAAVPALAVDAAAAITNLLRLRTGANDVWTVAKTGVVNFNAPGSGTWFSGGAGGVQILAVGAGSDIELCDAAANIIIQTTDDGKLGFYGHAAVARPNIAAVATPQSIADALVALGLCTQS